MKTVMIAGKFDPLHEGHIDHIRKASKLGDELLVVTHSDAVLERIKGKCNITLWARVAILKGILSLYSINGRVMCSLDGTMVETLRRCKPDIFAKGGDRTPDNMPQSEIDACEEIGCEIVYGVGDKLNSSSSMT